MKKSIHSESEMVKAVKEQRYGCESGQEIEGTGGGEPEAEADVRRPCIGQPDIEGCY